jgi:hypothetical protein
MERQRCKSQQELSFASTFIVEIGAFAEQESLNLLAKPVEAKTPIRQRSDCLIYVFTKRALREACVRYPAEHAFGLHG